MARKAMGADYSVFREAKGYGLQARLVVNGTMT